MKQFMQNFVGKGFHLLIKEKYGTFKVHTIEIMQKTDGTCPVKEIPIGAYFLRLTAKNQEGNEAAIICNWTEELLQDLMNTYKDAKDADFPHITMCRDTITNDANRWLLIWGNNHEQQKTNTPPYIR
ncbi:MAG TPA: hypothetical protein VGB11_01275 [Candidatus Bathyarchaeia archaeon]|jgi:hypothetical protein